MGFLDSLLGSSSSPNFNTQQAIMTIVVGAVKADGEVSRDEFSRIRAMCSLSPVFASNTSDQDDTVIRFADNVTTQLGYTAIEKAAQALKPGIRETAFAFACDMILADGFVGEDEKAFLGRLSQSLGISDEIGGTIVKATIVRNRAE